MHQDHYWWWS